MKLNRFVSILLGVALTLGFLIIGKKILVPILLAIVVWYLINAVNDLLRHIPGVAKFVAHNFSLFLSFSIVILTFLLIGNLVTQNINEMFLSAADYKVNLKYQLSKITEYLGTDISLDLLAYTKEFNLGDYIKEIITSLSAIASQFFLVLIYVLFLLLEQHSFPKKIKAFNLTEERATNLARIIGQINEASRLYIGVKFAASLVTGMLSFLVLNWVGLDFAFFWAFIIFILNFIPTIGSLVAIIFPALVSLIQFDTLSPFVYIIIGVGIIQLIIGAILEPRLYGASLNLSPLIIILSLILWGAIWGIVGMLLCVPLTVIFKIIFSQFPKTRPIAIILSKGGVLSDLK